MNASYLAICVSVLSLFADASSTAKNASKLLPFVASGLVGSTAAMGYVHAGPGCEHLNESDESLKYWANVLEKCPSRNLLLNAGLIPQLAVTGRFKSTGRNTLFEALSKGDLELSKKLLKAGADPNVDADVDFLSLVSKFLNPSTLVKSAIIHGLDINMRDSEGRLPLDRVLEESGNFDVAAVLMKYGAKSDRTWRQLAAKASFSNLELPSPDELTESDLYRHHRFLIAIYRASGRDQSIVLDQYFRLLQFRNSQNDRKFLDDIDRYDELLGTIDAEYKIKLNPVISQILLEMSQFLV